MLLDAEDTSLKFIEKMKKLVAYAYKHTAKFPRRYSSNYTNRLLMQFTLARESLISGNNININYKYWKYGKTDATYNLTKSSYEERTKYLKECINHLKLAADLLSLGLDMDISELREDDSKIFKEFMSQIIEECKLINGIIKSDSRAFKRFSIVFGKDFSTY